MATENPKVSGYVPSSVYDRLMEFKASRGLKSVSMAVTAALEEYFGLSQAAAKASDTTVQRLETLEGK
jgi:hypothetical protein